jgi:hypothetical protein
MRRSTAVLVQRLFALALFALCAAIAGPVRAQVNVTTYHNDIARSGQNLQETTLTPANVNSSQFGKVFTVTVDGFVYAQPLYLAGVTIGGGTHNVLYVATQHDSIYAIDADNGTLYWQVSLLPTGGRTVVGDTDIGAGCEDIVPEIGITGTPVIDPATGTLYVVAKSYVGGKGVQYLHAIDVGTAAEKFGGPVSIQGSVAGTGYDSKNSVVTFNAMQENQRPALLLENGHVIIGWSSHCDYDPWHGWIMSYSANALAQEAVFNATPNGKNGGIWMSGGGVAADAAGNLYFSTGNGDWNGTTDLGDSIVKLGPPSGGSFPLVDYFTPYDQASMDAGDIDVASSGPVLLPALPSGQQLLALMGKIGTIYVLDRNNMGKYCPSLTPACSTNDPQIVQEITGATSGVWGSAAYWNGNLYWGGQNDRLTAFSFNTTTGAVSTSPTSITPQIFGYPAPTASISANGASQGIVWVLSASSYGSTCSGGTNCQTLYAYDATNVATLLYSSSQAASYRDVPGSAVKFAVPTIANGKVYVGSQYAVSAYGALSGATPATASPTFSPGTGTYAAGQPVALSDATPGAVIYYTLDGSTPTTASAQYNGTALTISATTTINALALAGGYTSSGVSGATYTISSSTGTTPVSVSLGAADNLYGIATPGIAVVGNGLDGHGDAYAGNLLGTTVTSAGATFTLAAAGAGSAATNTTIALPAAVYANLSLLATGINGNQLNQSFVVTYTDGTTSTFTQSLSDWYTPQHYAGEAIASTMAYRIQASGVAQTGPVYLYAYSFALNSAKVVQSITLPKNANVAVLAIDLAPTGTVVTSPTASPTFGPATGTYSAGQPVTLSDATSGAVIYYTLDGSTPTTASAQYSGTALTISATTTINALALASSYTTSAVSSATYTISTTTGTTPISVSLGAADNLYGIATPGIAVVGSGLDGHGDAYAGNLLGTTITSAGATFTLAAAGAGSAATNTTIALPAASYATLSLLATGLNGNQLNQSFVVTYTDGTTSSFTQSLSDWYTPQHYTGETIAATLAYRIKASGVTQAGPVYLYAYSFALNSAKALQSITLPKNANVAVLAIDLAPTGTVVTSPTAVPTFSPATGTYTAGQPVTLSDATSGAVIYYTLDGSTPTTASAQYSGTALTMNATTTINALALASGYTSSAVSSATYTISTSTGTTPVSVSLGAADNLYGIATPGTAVTGGGLDGHGDSYAGNLLGTTVTSSGATFTLAAAGAGSAVTNTTIALPAASYATLSLLATGLNGNQLNQSFVVTYTDGTTSSFTQSLSDWYTPQHYTGETIAATMAYRIKASGVTQAGPVYLYAYSFALNSAKVVQSITLPKNAKVAVLAIDLTP